MKKETLEKAIILRDEIASVEDNIEDIESLHTIYGVDITVHYQDDAIVIRLDDEIYPIILKYLKDDRDKLAKELEEL